MQEMLDVFSRSLQWLGSEKTQQDDEFTELQWIVDKQGLDEQARVHHQRARRAAVH